MEFILDVKGAYNHAAQVATTIYVVTNIGEAVIVTLGLFVIIPAPTYVCLSVANHVGITAASKGIEDTTVTQIHVGVAHNRPFVTASIKELALCHV